MTQLVLEIACGYSAIEVPDGKAVPEQMWMDAMPILACLVLALDLLRRFVRKMHTLPIILNSYR
jgi:hypothetical protein